MKTLRLLLKLAASLIIWCACPAIILWIFVQPGRIDTAPLAIAMFGAWLACLASMKLASLVRKLTASLAKDSEMMLLQTTRQSELIERLNQSTCMLSEMREKLQEANTALATQSAWIGTQKTCWKCGESKKIMDSRNNYQGDTNV